MHCPGCRASTLSVKDRLLIALRAEVRCPACGVAIRFGLGPRILHSIFGDAFLIAGAIGAFMWRAPFVMMLACASWLSLSLLLPIEPDSNDHDEGAKEKDP
jgi:hypothetical protein